MNRWMLKMTFGTLFLTAAMIFVNPIYTRYKYAHIYGASVVRILGAHGGGTGFQIEYKGKTFIMTNDHVCGLADENGYVVIDSPFAPIQRSQVKYRSANTDLCLVSSVRELPSMKLGDKEFKNGENVIVLGHPLLDKLTKSEGGVIRTTEVDVFMRYIVKEEEDTCSLPKNRIREGLFGLFEACLVHVRTQETTAHIKPGNSGSPVLDSSGYVKGVVFAGSAMNEQGDIIPLNDIKAFLNSALKHPHMSIVY